MLIAGLIKLMPIRSRLLQNTLGKKIIIYYSYAKSYKIVTSNLTTINDCVINNNVVTRIVLPSILLYTIGKPISLQSKLYADVDDLFIITLQYNLIYTKI